MAKAGAGSRLFHENSEQRTALMAGAVKPMVPYEAPLSTRAGSNSHTREITVTPITPMFRRETQSPREFQ